MKLAFLLGFVPPFVPMALASSVTDIPDRVLTQCGLVSGLLVAAVVWLAGQHAKTRAAWEADRSGMAEIIGDLNTSLNNLSMAYAKQEGILLALRNGPK